MIGGAFEGVEDQVSPFGYKRGEGIDAGAGEPEWIVNKERHKYDTTFNELGPCDGKITGAGNLLSFDHTRFSSKFNYGEYYFSFFHSFFMMILFIFYYSR